MRISNGKLQTNVDEFRNGLSMRIREYRQADIAGLDDYALTELDAWEGIMQEIEGLEKTARRK